MIEIEKEVAKILKTYEPNMFANDVANLTKSIPKLIEISKSEDEVEPPLVAISITPAFYSYIHIYQMMHLKRFHKLGFNVSILFLDNMVSRYTNITDSDREKLIQNHINIATNYFKIDIENIKRWSEIAPAQINVIKEERDQILEKISISQLTKILQKFEDHASVEHLKAKDFFSFMDEYLIFCHWHEITSTRAPEIILTGEERKGIYGLIKEEQQQTNNYLPVSPIFFSSLPGWGRTPLTIELPEKQLREQITIYGNIGMDELNVINNNFNITLEMKKEFDKQIITLYNRFSDSVKRNDEQVAKIQFFKFIKHIFMDINKLSLEAVADTTESYKPFSSIIKPKYLIRAFKNISNPTKIMLLGIIMSYGGEATLQKIETKFYAETGITPSANQKTQINRCLRDLISVGLLEKPYTAYYKLPYKGIVLHIDQDSIQSWNLAKEIKKIQKNNEKD